ncbi:MAG: hypothetical protein AD073_000271 [Mycoplasmataceae bacterium]|nr:MAG: hypothetical protein AD073_000271 [Mycoplasmataceae bacterium]
MWKVLVSLEFINKGLSEENEINYLWMNQMCVNQFDNEGQFQEIGNGVNKTDEVEFSKRLIKITAKSDWFTRNWTFQEGLLSEQNIFMFDDYLVDGRFYLNI